jgi:hypothetical protein
MAINAYWSPLYPALIGLFLRALQPSPYWEYAVVHLVNFVTYLGAGAGFGFMLQELIRHEAQRFRYAPARVGLTRDGWILLGTALFIWASVVLISLWRTTPDMLVAALVYVAAGLLLRIRRGAATIRTFALLGLVLGAAYLAKAPMFPLAAVFLGASLLIAGHPRVAVPRVLVAVIVFAAVVGPWLAAISISKGRFTFGASGTLNFAWSGGTAPDRHWQGGDGTLGAPAHPTRRVAAPIPVYEFGTPVGGTYPVWYDPSYWSEGLTQDVEQLTARAALMGRLRILGINLGIYYHTFFGVHGSLILGLLLLSYMSGQAWWGLTEFARCWFLAGPAIAALAMYVMVWAGQRLIAPFVVLLFLAAYASRSLPDSPDARRLLRGIPLLVLIMLAISVSPTLARAGASAVTELLTGHEETTNEYWQAAAALRELGLAEGETVAVMRVDSVTGLTHSKWARLARVRIVAEADAKDASSAVAHDEVMRAMRTTGAAVVVADEAPPWSPDGAWRRVDGTRFFAHFLR